MISNLQKRIIVVLLFSYLLFFYIKDEEYNKMICLSIITCILSHFLIQKEDIYEGVSNSVEFTEEEEESRRQAWLEELGETEEATDQATAGGSDQATAGETDEETGTPVPSNTPFVSAEYVKLREKARQKDGPIVTEENDTPDGVGPTDPEPSSTEEEFVEKEEVKLKVVEDKFRIGPYDGLCVSSDKLTEEDYFTNEELVTYFGVHGPIQVLSSQDVLTGPTIDGEKDSPQKLSMFANNKTSFNCCGESPYTTSTGCLCLTNKQRSYLLSRGSNKNSPDI